jgi:hypothetical protein
MTNMRRRCANLTMRASRYVILLCSYVASVGLSVAKDVVSTYLSDASAGQQLVYVNGHFSTELSDLTALPAEVFVGSALEVAGDKAAQVMGALVSQVQAWHALDPMLHSLRSMRLFGTINRGVLFCSHQNVNSEAASIITRSLT